MAIPATSGSFKTNILDMAIGDYIAFKYAASSGAAGTFSEFGVPLATAQANEIAVAGAAAPNGYGYALKVAPGLLLCDRVLQHSISHDVLNAAKFIQGKFFANNGDILIRSLTGGVAYLGADGLPTSSRPWDPYTSLDHATGSFASPNPYTKTFSSPVLTNTIGFRVPLAGGDQTVAEVQIFDENNVNIAAQATITAIGSPNLTGIGLAGLVNGDVSNYQWDNAGDIDGALFTFSSSKSISKVVIYGGSSYTLKDVHLVKQKEGTLVNTGCFPPVNEFDKYIRGSNLGGKITAGDAAVWNHASVATLCQDTPSTIIGTSTNRTKRTSLSDVISVASSTAETGSGFRPVFEFLETDTKASNLWY